MTLSDILTFGAATTIVALVVHFFVRRYWLAVLISALASSLVNLAHEVVGHSFAVRPSDAALWLPGLFILGADVSLPIVAIIGIPFHVIRRRKQTKMANKPVERTASSRHLSHYRAHRAAAIAHLQS